MKNALYILLSLTFCGCVDSDYVRFETPQPEGIAESATFKRKVRGTYLNCSEANDKLIITDQLILNARTVKFKVHRADLVFDTTITANLNSDEELSALLEDEGYAIKIIGDTVNGEYMDIDTIFQVSEAQVLKKFRGSYFLNFKRDKSYWDVHRLNLRKDSLLIGKITPSDTLLRFDFTSKEEQFNAIDSSSTTKYSLNPSKREFKKLLKPNSFDRCQCYYKSKK